MKNISEREIGFGGNKTKILAIEFEYKTKYDSINAKINISGEIMYTDEKQKEILKKWEKENKIDDKIGLPLLNYIFKMCCPEHKNC